MPRSKQTIPVDDYVLDVLMRDLIGHDQQPAAYLVYLYLYGQATRMKWKPVTASLRKLAGRDRTFQKRHSGRSCHPSPPPIDRHHA